MSMKVFIRIPVQVCVCVCVPCLCSSIVACVSSVLAAMREHLQNGSHEANCDRANSSHWHLHKQINTRTRDCTIVSKGLWKTTVIRHTENFFQTY